MTDPLATDSVIDRTVLWANGQEAIRAMLLTSTRAVPGAQVDALSDYDIVLVMRDVEPFATDRGWISAFGEVLVAYWDPLEADPETGFVTSGNVVQYADGLKIDFSLWPVAMLDALSRQPSLPAELDAGYRVLLDKDSMADGLQPPTYRGYIPDPPDEETYLTNVNDFYIGVPYVAKCLLRDEILPAKWVLDYDMRYVYLMPMLEWRMECDHGWSVSLGVHGRGLKRRLPPEIWRELEATHAGTGIEANWEVLFRMISLYRRVARDVGASLGYAYPEELDARVTDFTRRMREGEFGLP